MIFEDDNMFNYKLVIVVRSDVDMTPGKLAVQASHASVSCALESKSKKGKYFKRWLKEGQKKVLVKCADIHEMESLRNKAEREGLTTKMVSDAGLTEVERGTKTCLGIGPGPDKKVDNVTGHLSLY